MQFYPSFRPYLIEFLEWACQMYEVVLFTASEVKIISLTLV